MGTRNNLGRHSSEHNISTIGVSNHTMDNGRDPGTHIIEIDLFNEDGERINQITLFGTDDGKKIKLVLDGKSERIEPQRVSDISNFNCVLHTEEYKLTRK